MRAGGGLLTFLILTRHLLFPFSIIILIAGPYIVTKFNKYLNIGTSFFVCHQEGIHLFNVELLLREWFVSFYEMTV